jgi:segregation and condensation protein A
MSENESASAGTAPDQMDMDIPLAVVLGEPYSDTPKDLYIPPDALEVFLETFEGPLDLLLYLIKKQNLDILDIPVASITHQYMQYIAVMEMMRIELAAEYLVMAAMLAEIKSRLLLPRPEEDTDEDDPRAELVRRLQMYEQFKKAAEDLDNLTRMERDVFEASAGLPVLENRQPLPDVKLEEMLAAFKAVVMRANLHQHHNVKREFLSVRERMSSLLVRLQEQGEIEFVSLFSIEEGRAGCVVTFLAMLELCKESLLEIHQEKPFAPITIRPATQSSMHERVNFESTEADPDASYN